VNTVASAKTSMIVVFASLKRIEAEKCRQGARKVPSWRQKSAVMAPEKCRHGAKILVSAL
jgi:hypothetical protein